MVALVFRHLATFPGSLDWAWRALAPAWRSGLLQETAWRLARDVPVPALAPMTGERLAALQVDAAGLAGLRAVTGAYNRANPLNLLSTLSLLRLVDGAAARETPPARD